MRKTLKGANIPYALREISIKFVGINIENKLYKILIRSFKILK